MGTIRLGYGKLYNCPGITLKGREEILMKFPNIGGEHLDAQVYIGPKPRYRTFSFTISAIPKDLSFEEITDDVQRTIYEIPPIDKMHGKLFTQILILQAIEVDDATADSLVSLEALAKDKALKMAAAAEARLDAVGCLVAGIIGMRLHPSLVSVYVGETFYAFPSLGTKYAVSIQWKMNSSKSFEWSKENDDAIMKGVRSLTFKSDTTDTARRVLTWLLRAWGEADTTTKFLALFIPLEMILEGVFSQTDKWSASITNIRELVQTYGAEQRDSLLTFLGQLNPPPPTLGSRFETLAKAAGMPEWELDATALRRFNRMRNDLLHRGDPPVSLKVSVGESDTRTLQDIVERYVNYVLFGDDKVYPRDARA